MYKLPDPTPETTYYPVAAVRRIDRAAIDGAGIPGYTLMTRAAEASLAAAEARYPRARRYTFLCGGGNNAGDAYVMARLAHERGVEVAVHSLVDPGRLDGDARTAAADFAGTGQKAVPFAGALAADCDLIIDGLLGSGLERDVAGDFLGAVRCANDHPAPVLSLDIPTGLNGDSGRVMGSAVVADTTVSFVGLKAGLLLGAGPAHCGQVVFAGLDIPERCRDGIDPAFRRLPANAVAEALPARPREAHKGLFGHVVIVGGGPGMPGAVRIAGEACLRAGAGLVSIATHPSHAASVNVGRPELMVQGIADADGLASLLERASVVAVGPGLGRSGWAAQLFDAVAAAGRPLVVDADALNLLADAPRAMPAAVLTPHPGEAARLLKVSGSDIQSDRLNALANLVDRYEATVVLKGSGSLVGTSQRLPFFCAAGNPGMASAGMGDALTGIIAAFLGQGFDAEAAAALGVELHARAGDAAARSGERGLLASDLIACLRDQVNP